MFPGPWTTLPDFVAHDWPPHAGEQELAQMARRVCEAWSIRDGDTVVGASLGGMVGCEIAKLRRLEALYLVGSAIRKDEISQLLAALHPLADLAPLEWLRAAAGRIPADLARMFASVDAAFVRSMCHGIFRWEGLGSTEVRCFRVHGSRDRVIPRPARVDLLLEGGHLISMTHPGQCVAFIAGDREEGRTQGP